MTQVNNHKSTGHTSFLNGDSLATSAESLRLQAQRSLLLNRITTQLDTDYDEQINRALSLVRRAFELDFVIVSQIEGSNYTIKYLAASQEGLEQGQVLDVSQTYCELVYNSNEIIAINHASESEYKTHPCFEWSELESYVGAPLQVDDVLYGTVAFSNIEPRPVDFTDIDLEFLQIFTNWVSGVLSRKNAAEGLQQAVDNMTQLYQFSSILNQATTVEELFLTAIQPSIEAGATFANLFSIQVDHNNRPEFINMITSWSASGESPLAAGTRFDLSDFEIAKYWIASRKPVFIGDIENDQRLTEAAREVYSQVGAKATITYPLTLQNQWVGVISLNWPHVRQFSEVDRQQYEAISYQTAAVLYNLIHSEHESKRAQALETVSKVSAAVSSILNMPELLKTVVDLTKEQFNLYHAHLYLVDQSKNQLRLSSGAGETGEQMVSEGRTIPLDAQQSLVARAARSTSGFIVNDVANEPGFLPHPLLPDTASELAVPIISGETVLGVLDVQAAQINYFTEDDLDILNTLAAQIAPALQNAQAFDQIRTARTESQKAQDRTEAILKSTTLPLVITRVSDGLALYANEPIAKALRMSLDDIMGQKSPDFYNSPEDRQLFLKSLMENGYIENYELQLVRSDGDRFWALVSARLFDYEGQAAIVSTLADITDRKEAEDRIETILKSVNLPLAITRISDGHGMYANEPFGEVFHMSVDEFIGRKSPDFYADPADRAGLLKGVHEEGYTRNYETRLKRNDGEIFWALMSARAIQYEGHDSIMTTIIDITERKEAAEALRRSQEDNEAILEYSPEAIGLINTETGLFESLNTRAIELFDLLPEEIGQVGPADVSPETQPDGTASEEKAIQKLGEALQGGNPVFEWMHINKKGELIPCEVKLAGLTGDRSHFVRFSTTDISERKKAAEALRRSQEDIAAILESSPEAVGVVNTQTGLFENPNVKAELLYGLPHDELIKVGPAQMSPEFQPNGRSSTEAAMEKIGEALQGSNPVFEWTHINSKGEEIPCEVRLSGLGGDRSHLVRFSVTDISERKALEAELRLLQQAFSESTQPLTIADMRQEDQPLVYVNPAFEKKTGYALEEVIGKNCRFLQGEDRDQEGLTILRQALKAGESCDVELRNYHKDGTLFWNRLVMSPVKNAAGQVTHFIGSQRDITERKENEARLAKQAADLATVAEVSTAVSTIQNVDEMLQTVVDLTKERFDLYHAHIFVLDDTKQTLVLTAGADAVGREMVTEGREIPLTAEGSLVATVGRNLEGQIRNYEGEMEGFAPHPALIDTRTELAVPLTVGGELLGVLDVRSEQSYAFSESDVQIQSTLASQIAVALQNARSFEQTKQAEAELQANQTRLETILNNLPVGVFVADAQTGVPELANDTALELLGRGLDPNSGAAEYTEVYQTYHVDADEPLPAQELPLVKTMTTGEIHYGQLDILRSDDRITVDVTAVPIFNENNTMTSAIALFQDITERRRSEGELIIQNSALEAAANGIAITNREGQFIRVNSAFTKLTGYEAEDVIGKTTRILKSGKQTSEFYKEMWDTVLAGDVWQGELINKRKDGSLYTEEMTITPVRDTTNEITHFIAIKRDVSERKQLLERIEQLAAVVENSPDFVGIGSLTGQAIYVNPAGLEILGASADEDVTSLQAQDFYSEENAQSLTQVGIPHAMEHGFWSGDALLKQRNGGLLPVSQTVGLIRNEEGVPYAFSITMRDITEQQQARAAMLKQAAEFETVAQIGITVSSSLDTNLVLQEVVDLTKENFDLYHAHIYLLDEAGNNLVLTAGAGKVGRQMVGQARSIPLQAPSVVAQAARTGQATIVNNVRRADNFLPNPLLPKTRSEMAVPIIFGGAVLGVLDVQSNVVDQFTEQDVNIQTTLASEVAVAIENARQYEQTQRALAETASQAKSLEKLSALSLILANVNTEEEAFKTVAEYATEIVESQRTSIALLNKEKTHLELFAIDGTQGTIPTGMVLPVNGTAIGHVTQAQKLLNISDTTQSEFMDAKKLSQTGVLSTIVAPLFIGGEIIGTINFGFSEFREQNTNRNQLVQQLTGLFGQTLANGRLLEQIQTQAAQLRTVADLGTIVATISEPQEMLQTVVDLTKERFDLYHTHIFLLDDEQETLLLTAGADEVGREMVAEGRRIPVAAEGSLVATAARTRQAQIRNYEGEMEGFAPHPALIDTRTEMAVPLLVGNQLLGILDVRSEQENAFGETDIQIQSTLASQVAVALQNARQYEETQKANQETARLYDISQRINVATTPLELLQGFMEPLKDQGAYQGSLFTIETDANNLPQTLAQLETWEIDGKSPFPNGTTFDLSQFPGSDEWRINGDLFFFNVETDERIGEADREIYRQVGAAATSIFPLKLGREWVGVLIVTWREPQPFTDDDIRLFQSLAEQMAVVLNGYNLLQQTRERAAQLQLVSEVSTTVSSLQNSQEMLQTVVDLTKDRFGLYHAHTFVLDDAGETLILTAGAGDVGREMVAEGRRIPVAAEGSLVATAARTRQSQIRNYEAEMEGYAPHPALIDTRTEMAVPLLAGDTLLGVLDVRSVRENAFGDIDIQIQSTLASQVAIALQNARQFEQTERARRELSVITQRLTREGWEEFLTDHDEDILRYGYNLQAVQELSDDQFFTTAAGSAVSAPLVVQDTQLGHVAVELPEEPDNDTAEVIMSVVSNLSAHIENIRLNEQTFKALADTESLYYAINQIVRAVNTNDILNALIESTVINQMDRANLFMFNRPWDDVEPEYAIVDALWEQGKDAADSPAATGTIYYINQITTIRSFKRDQVVIYNDILTDERVDPLSRQNLSALGTRSFYVFPLVVNQQWIGAVTAQSSEPNYEINENNLRQISTLTEQAATTIANRRLLAQAQERAERERRVRAITDRIRSGTNREDILKIAREEIGNLLGTSKSVVQLGTKQQLVSKLNKNNGHD